MYRKEKLYSRVRFPARVIEEAHDLFLSMVGAEQESGELEILEVSIGNERWDFETRAEFLVEYPRCDYCHFYHEIDRNRFGFVAYERSSARLEVALAERSSIESIFLVFERNLEESRLDEEAEVVESKPVTVFIGHGRDTQWRDLKDHMQDQHGIPTVAYEIGPRAGLSIKEVLQDMLEESSFALLVLTGEDIHTDGELHARENVVHEVGLFQGRLGFRRAIVLLEEGVKEFSNILGVNEIRFSKGRIRETFGDVLATLRREFEHGER